MCVLLYSSFLRGALWEAAFDGVPFFPLGIWDAENRIFLDNVSRLFGLSLFVLGHFSLLGVDLGLSIKWAGVVKFFGPIYIYIYIYTISLRNSKSKLANIFIF